MNTLPQSNIDLRSAFKRCMKVLSWLFDNKGCPAWFNLAIAIMNGGLAIWLLFFKPVSIFTMVWFVWACGAMFTHFKEYSKKQRT